MSETLADEACGLACRRLTLLEDEPSWIRPDTEELVSVILRHAEPRRRVAPLLDATLRLAVEVGFFWTEGHGARTQIEEMLTGTAHAVAGDTAAELRQRIAAEAEEIEPLTVRFAKRVASPKSGWSDPPGYTFRLLEAASDIGGCAAVLAARSMTRDRGN